MKYFAYFFFLLAFSVHLQASVFFIDYENGDDRAEGTSPTLAWKHSPGDPNATGNPNGHVLGPGDHLVFKGGVIYRGGLSMQASGTKGRPIVLDGEREGFGTGKAILSGGQPILDWSPVSSASEVDGNPHYNKILKAKLPEKANWKTVNLLQANRHMLSVAQSPNMPDPFFQERAAHYHNPGHRVREEQSIQIEALGMTENRQAPIIWMIDGSGRAGVINVLTGGGLNITFPEPVKIARIGITPQKRYAWPKEFSVSAGGKNLGTFTLKGTKEGAKGNVEQVFDLGETIETKTLHFTFINAQPENATWGKLRHLKAYTPQGNNVLVASRTSYLQDRKVFNQDEPDYWDDATIALHVQPNKVIYSKVLGFDPARGELKIETLNSGQYESTKYSIFNSLNVLDRPGEYVVRNHEDGTSTIFVWPLEDAAMEISRSVRTAGVRSGRSDHLVIKNIRMEQYAGAAISAQGKKGAMAQDLHIKGIEARYNRSPGWSVVNVNRYRDVVIEDCVLEENAGHMKGILVSNSENVLTRGCVLRRGSSTALDYYTVKNGAVFDCVVTENKGMHANGLTFYVGCENILVEGNRVRDGNVALTLQDGKNMIIRNNILEGGGGFAIGIWDGKTYHNILIANNILLSHSDRSPAVFGGNSQTKQLYVVNNIMNGPGGNSLLKGRFENNVVFTDSGTVVEALFDESNVFVSERANVFLNGGERDYRHSPASPAIGAGKPLDIAGVVDVAFRPRRKGVDIGAYSAVEAAKGLRPWNGFSWGGFEFPELTDPRFPHENPNFEHVGGEPRIVVDALSYIGQEGGNVNRRESRRYFSGWDNKDHWLEWKVTAPEAGEYELCVIQASALQPQRSFILNGEPVKGLQNVPMTLTGDWRKFVSHWLEAPIELQKGDNTLRVVNNTGTPCNFRELRFYKIK